MKMYILGFLHIKTSLLPATAASALALASELGSIPEILSISMFLHLPQSLSLVSNHPIPTGVEPHRYIIS